MTKQEFKRRVNEADNCLASLPRLDSEDRDLTTIYVCDSLQRNFGIFSALKFYKHIMEPCKDYDRSLSWFGDPTKKNLNTRKPSLRLFEQAVLNSGEYKEGA